MTKSILPAEAHDEFAALLEDIPDASPREIEDAAEIVAASFLHE